VLRKSSVGEIGTMRCLCRQIWSHPVLLLVHPTLFQEVRRSLQNSSGKRSQFAATRLAANGFGAGFREAREGSMNLQISRRGKEYLRTAQTLLQAAERMTDRAIAGQLKALADDYERRAGKASYLDAAKASERSAANLNANGPTDYW
jgi:hypothetical protein